MHLENGRDLFRSVMILVSVAIAYWVDLIIGLVLAVLVGIMILQSAWTDWCPIDLILQPLGLKKKLQIKT